MAYEWYIAETGNVKKFVNHLQSLDIDHFSPFPHYVYLRLNRDDTAKWGDAISCDGLMHRLLPNTLSPEPVDHSEVLRLINKTQKPVKLYVEGTEVTILSGLLAGSNGILKDYRNDSYSKATVTIETIRSTIDVIVDTEIIGAP